MKPKLVRDGIPELIIAEGRSPKFSKVSGERYFEALVDKLREELSEFATSRNPEELADVLGVVHAMAKYLGVSPERIENMRHQKAKERGGFNRGFYLEDIAPRREDTV